MSRKMSAKSQQKIDWALQQGIIANELIKVYGLAFVLKLIKELTKGKKTSSNTTNLIYPKLTPGQKYSEVFCQQYYKHLKNAGFKLKEWKEDFIDEDTGEIVAIERKEIYYIN
jgi:hypothetical protein